VTNPSIVHVADIHFGCEDARALDALAAALPAIDPALIVVAGDLTYRGRKREFEAAAAWLTTLGCPIVIAAGNHDAPYFNLVDRVLEPFHRFDRSFAERGVQTYQDDAFSIVSLNTARAVQMRLNWAHGVISTTQALAASARLAEMQKNTARIVVCHHPMMVPDGAPIKTRTRGGAEAAEIFAQGGVDLVLTGHLHRPFAQAFPFADRKTWSIGCGTLSHRQRGTPASFSVLTRTPGGVEVTPWHAMDGAAHPTETQRIALRR
jgi:3',5'-cyclic AMP phosphodiesterase CpdA